MGVMNKVRGLLPSGSEFLNKAFKLRSMNELESKRILEELKLSVHLDAGRKQGIKCMNAADKLKKANDYAEHLFGSIKFPKDADRKLDLSVDAIQKLNLELANTEATVRAIDHFKSKLTKHNEQMSEQNADVGTRASELLRLRGDLTEEMKSQHATELQKFEALFQDAAFIKMLEPNDAKEVKPLMLSALKTSQKKQLEDFEKAVTPDVKQMLAVTNQAEASALLCHLMEKNNSNAAFLKAITQRRKSKGPNPISVSVENPDDSARFSEADLKTLTEYTTSSGKKVTMGANNKSFQLESSAFGFGTTAGDLLEIALLGKAMGWATIEMTVHHDNPKIAERMAHDAYEACLKAGYSKDEITINIQDAEGKPHKKEPSQLNINPDEIKSLLSTEANINPVPSSKTAQYREQAKAQRDQMKPEQQPAAPVTQVTGGDSQHPADPLHP